MSEKKILVLAHEPYLNGASHSLLSILVELKYEYEFLVIIPDSGLMEDALKENNINYKILNIPRCAYFTFVSAFDHLKRTYSYYKTKSLFLNELVLICKEFDPEIIYTNTSVLSLGYDLSKKINVPHIWHIREYGDKNFDLVYIPNLLLIKRKIKNSRFSVFTTNLLKMHWGNISLKNARVIYNGIVDNKSLHGISKKFPTDNIKIGIVGMIMPNKGQLEAVRIFKKVSLHFPNIELWIYGQANGHYQRLINEEIKSNMLTDRVRFLGFKKHSDIYRDLDVLLSCSKNEGFGRTIVEAMGYGIPVVAKNVGGPTEIIQNSVDGFLYDSETEAADIVVRLLKDSECYMKISGNAKINSFDKFSLYEYVNKVSKIFNRCLDE